MPSIPFSHVRNAEKYPQWLHPRWRACVACMVLLLPSRGTEPSTVKRTEVAGGRALAVHGSPGFIIEKTYFFLITYIYIYIYIYPRNR